MTDLQPDAPSSDRQVPAKAETSAPQWLTLSEAADFLGIHFSTMRSWADKGEIRVFRTPGGHRRFSAGDLRRFLEERAHGTDLANVEVIMESALVKVRAEMDKMPLAQATWRANLNEQDRQTRQERGRQLFSLALSFVLKPGHRGRLLDEGRILGREYGHEAARSGVSLAESGRAVQFFRTQLLSAVRDGDERSPLDMDDVRIQRVIDHFLDEILYAVLDGYEQELKIQN
jgi:excisionase family DNA binding protein